MSNRQIDERVVEMKFNNDNFEKNAAQTMKTLKALDTALNVQSAKNINDISDAIKKVNFKHIEDGLDSLNNKFSTVGTFSRRMVENIADSTYGLLKNLKKMTVDKAFSFAWNNIISGGEARASKIEQARFSLKGILDNDSARVAAVMEDVDESVTGTAYGYDQAAQAAAMLVTSGRAATKENGNLLQDLKAIAGLTAQTNGNYQEFADIFTKVATAGKVTNDRMQQLNTRGISAYETMADFFNKVKNGEETTVKLTKEASDEILNLTKNVAKVTGADIQQMISDSKKNGGISFDVFSAAMNDAFAANAFKANETLSGVMDNLAAQFKQIGQKFYSPIIAQNSELVKLIDAVRLKVKDFKSEVFFESSADNMNIADEFAYTVLAVAKATKEWVESIDIRKVAEVAINVIQGLVNIFHALSKIIQSVGAGIKQTLGLFNINDVIHLAEGFNDITDALVLSNGAAENFTRGAAGISRLIKEIMGIGLRFIKGISPIKGDIVEILNGAIDGFSNVLGYLGDIADAVAEEIANFSELDDLFSSIGKAARAVFGAIMRLIGGIRESDEYVENIKNLKDFISGIISIVNLLAKITSSFFTSLFKSESQTETKNKTLLGVLLEILGLIGRITKSVGDFLTNTNVAQTLAGLLAKVLTFVFNTLGKIYNLVKDIASSAALKTIVGIVEWLKDTVLHIADFAQNGIGSIFDRIGNFGKTITGIFGKNTKDDIDGVSDALYGTAVSLQAIEETEPDTLLSKFVKRIKTFFEDLRSGRTGTKLFDNINENIVKFKDTIKDFYKDIKEGTTGIGVIDNLSKIVSNIKESFTSNGTFASIIEELKEFGKVVLDTAKGIKDSTKDYSEGTNIITRFIESFKNIEFRGSILSKWEAIKEKMKSIKKALQKFVSDIYNNILPYLKKINFKGIFAAIVGTFAIAKILKFVGMITAIPFSITKAITNLVNSIKTIMTTINEWLPKLFKSLVKVIDSASLTLSAAAFLGFAAGIGIIAGAVALLAYTFHKDGWAFAAALGGIALLSLIVIGVTKIFSKNSGSGNNTLNINRINTSALGIIGILMSLTGIITALGLFMMVPFQSDWNDRFKSLIELFGLVGGVLIVAIGVSTYFNKGITVFSTIIAVAFLLVALSNTFRSVIESKFPESNDLSIRMGILVTLIFAMIGIVWALIKFSDMAQNKNVFQLPIWNIIAMCLLLSTMVSSFKKLMAVDMGSLYGLKLVVLAGMLFALYEIINVITKNTPSSGTIFSAGGTLLGVSALLLSIVTSLNILFNTDFMSHGILGFIGRITLLALVIGAMAGIIYEIAYVTPAGTTALKAGATIMALAAFLLVLTPSLVILSRFNFWKILGAVVEVGLVIGALTVCIGIMNKIAGGFSMQDSYKQILAMTAALLGITVALSLLSMLDPGQTGQNAMALSLVLIAIGGALAILNKFKKFDYKHTGLLQIGAMIAAIIAIAGAMYMLKDLNALQVFAMGVSIAGILFVMSVAISKVASITKDFTIKDLLPIVAAILVILAISAIVSGFSRDIDPKRILAFGAVITALSGAVALIAGLMGTLDSIGSVGSAGSGVFLLFLKAIGIVFLVAVVVIAITEILGKLNADGTIDRGVKAAETLSKGISRIVAGLITGFIESFGETFEKVGNNIKAFAENTREFFETINSLSTDKVTAFSELIQAILSIGGGVEFENFANKIGKYQTAFVTLGACLTNFTNNLNIGDKIEDVRAIVPLLQTLTNPNLDFTWIVDNEDIIGNVLPNLAESISRLAKRARNIDKNAEVNLERIVKILNIFTEIKETVDVPDLSNMTNMEDLTMRISSIGGKLVTFATNVKMLEPASVDRARYARDILIALGEASGSISKDKGLFGMIFDFGTNEIKNLSENLTIIGYGVSSFARNTKDLDPDIVEKAAMVGTVLTDMSVSLNDKKGGLADEKASAKFSKNLTDFGRAFSTFYTNLSIADGDKFEKFVETMKLITEAVQLDYQSMRELPEKMGELARSGIYEYIQAFVTSATSLRSEMDNFINAVWWALAGDRESKNNKYFSAGGYARNAFAEGIVNDYNFLDLKIKALKEHIANKFKKSDDESGNQFIDLGVFVSDSVGRGLISGSDIVKNIKDFVEILVTTIEDNFKLNDDGLYDLFITIGTHIPESLSSGMTSKSAIENLAKKTVSMASVIETVTRDTTGVHSPSEIFKSIGMEIPDSIADGIESNYSSIVDAAENMGTSIIATVASVVEELKNNPDLDIGQAIANVVEGGKEKVNDYYNIAGLSQLFMDKGIDVNDDTMKSLMAELNETLSDDEANAGLLSNKELDDQIAKVKKEYIEAIREAKKNLKKNDDKIGNSIADLRKEEYSNYENNKAITDISKEYAKKIRELEDMKQLDTISRYKMGIFNENNKAPAETTNDYLKELTDSLGLGDSGIDDETKEELEEATKKAKTWSTVPYRTSKGTSMGAYQQVIDEIKILEEQVQAIQQKVGAYNVTLDTGALVGQLGPKIDAYMGNAAILNGR